MVTNPQSTVTFGTEQTLFEEKDGRQPPKIRKPRAPWGTLGLPEHIRNEDDIYAYEYTLANAFSVLDRSRLSEYDKELIRNFDTLLQALGVSLGRRSQCTRSLQLC